MEPRSARRAEGIREWLDVVIVAALATYLVIGVVVWSRMILSGSPTPDAFTTILAAIAGALAGVVTPRRTSGGTDRRDDG